MAAIDKASRLEQEARLEEEDAAKRRRELNSPFPYRVQPVDFKFWLG